MKKEGKQQHVMRSYKIAKNTPNSKIQPSRNYPNSNSRPIKNNPIYQSPPPQQPPITTKPIFYYSKYTPPIPPQKLRYMGCHSQPKDNNKGTHKLRSSDVSATNHRLVSCRVGDDKGLHGFNYVGRSADEVLDQLSNYYHDRDSDDDLDDDEEGNVDLGVSVNQVLGYYHNEFDDVDVENGNEDSFDLGSVEIGNGAQEDEGFHDVGFFVIENGDEDWCLVGEL